MTGRLRFGDFLTLSNFSRCSIVAFQPPAKHFRRPRIYTAKLVASDSFGRHFTNIPTSLKFKVVGRPEPWHKTFFLSKFGKFTTSYGRTVLVGFTFLTLTTNLSLYRVIKFIWSILVCESIFSHLFVRFHEKI